MVDEMKIRAAMQKSWSINSARQWRADKPVAGQCNVTTAVIYDLYGGDILKTPWNEQTHHYYNSFNGERIDFTDKQFDAPIEYKDQPSSKDEASVGFTESEYESLKTAFIANMKEFA